MFGYITADPSRLSPEEVRRYSGCYCGLCRDLKDRYGFLGRITLTYDMTFLILLLSSLYEPEETVSSSHCPVHPIRRRDFFQNTYTAYSADLNLLLAYYNCMDDWQDEKKFSSRAMASLLQKHCEEIWEKYPRQATAISENLALLQTYEDGPDANADAAADCFGRLMGELFVPKEHDYWASTLRAMGTGLGRFIYIMDACIDYHSDLKHHRPNPLKPLSDEKRTREEDFDLMTMLLSDCTAAFEHLPLEQDLNLMRHILYEGVWQKYNQAFYRRDKSLRKEKEKQDDRPL